MKKELNSMKTNKLRYLVNHPRNIKLENKMILKVKSKLNGSIEIHKAQLVEKSFNQEVGINYEKKISTVVKFTYI